MEEDITSTKNLTWKLLPDTKIKVVIFSNHILPVILPRAEFLLVLRFCPLHNVRFHKFL